MLRASLANDFFQPTDRATNCFREFFFSLPGSLAQSSVRATQRLLRQELPYLCKLPSLWTRSCFVSTAGNVFSQTLQQFIENQ